MFKPEKRLKQKLVIKDNTCEDVEEIVVGQYPLNAELVVDESIFLLIIFYHPNKKVYCVNKNCIFAVFTQKNRKTKQIFHSLNSCPTPK